MSGNEYDEVHLESTPQETSHRGAAPLASAPAPPPSTTSTNLVLALGGVSLAFGIALTFAPLISGRLAGLGRTLYQFGYDAPAFTWAGFGLLAVGAVGRALLRSGHQDTDFSLVGEQIAFELDGMQDSLVTVTETMAQMVVAQTTLLKRQEDLEDDEHATKERNYDAVFRLAASLDQLSARLDERVSSLATEIQQRAGGVIERVQESRAALELELRNQSHTQTQALSEAIERAATTSQAPAQQAPAQQAPVQQAPAQPAPAPAPVQLHVNEPQPEPAPPAPEVNDGELHISVDLEDEGPPSQVAKEILDDIGSALPNSDPTPQVDLYGAPSEASQSLDSLLPEEAIGRALEEDRDRQG